MTRQGKVMWLLAIGGWLLITFPASSAERIRVLAGCALLLASCVLSINRIKS